MSNISGKARTFIAVWVVGARMSSQVCLASHWLFLPGHRDTSDFCLLAPCPSSKGLWHYDCIIVTFPVTVVKYLRRINEGRKALFWPWDVARHGEEGTAVRVSSHVFTSSGTRRWGRHQGQSKPLGGNYTSVWFSVYKQERFTSLRVSYSQNSKRLVLKRAGL